MESGASASVTWLNGRPLRHWIGGAPIDRPPSRTVPLAPALRGTIHGPLPVATTEEIDAFMVVVGGGLGRWLALSPEARKAGVMSLSDAIEANADRLSAVLQFEMQLAAELADAQVRRSYTRMREILAESDSGRSPDVPAGIGAIVTSRHRSGKVLMALFTRVLLNDSVIVIKPSEAGPLIVELLVELANTCELPPGVVNVVHGDEETVDALVTNPHVAAVYFDGNPDSEQHMIRLATLCEKPIVLYAEDPQFAGTPLRVLPSA